MTSAEADPWSRAGGGSTKYYKGLGTSTAAEAREYFEKLPHHRTQFSWGGAPDADAIDMAFSVNRAPDRKSWLANATNQIAQGTFGRPADAAATGPTAAAGTVADRGAAGAAGAAVPDAGAPAPPALDAAKLKKALMPELKALMAEHGLSAVRDGKRLPVAEMRELLAGRAAAPATPAALTASGACREDRTWTFSQFVREELVHFSLADNRRSLPSLIDGLKPSQRKALHACFEKKLDSPPSTREIKVQTLASYTSETLDYKHGEVAMIETIKRMAQDYVGANNVPLLVPRGQFGTRAMGGNDSAAARYINTRLSPVTSLLFPPADMPVLERNLGDDSELTEPVHFVPVLPVLLLNGAVGIGTGWSTDVPGCHPMEVLDNVVAHLEGRPMSRLLPWSPGFKGTVEPGEGKTGPGGELLGVVSRGVAERVKGGVLVSELPLGMWTDDYKAWLRKQQEAGTAAWSGEPRDGSTDVSVSLHLKISEGQLDELGRSTSMLNKLGLTRATSLRNMHGFDAESRLVRVATPLEVIEMHAPVRLRTYELRRMHELAAIERELLVLDAKARFLELVCSGELTLGRVARTDLVAQLQRLDFMPLADADGADGGGRGGRHMYSHLLDMPLQSLTEERLVQLSRRRETRCACSLAYPPAPALAFHEMLLTLSAAPCWQAGIWMPSCCGAPRQRKCGCASWRRSGLHFRLPSKDRRRPVVCKVIGTSLRGGGCPFF